MSRPFYSGLKVSSNGRFIVAQDETPFFWLADTAWELLHKLSREEIEYYVADRLKKGFNVIQTVILAELDGLRQPNAYGQIPFENLDPEKPNSLYFDHVDWFIDLLAEHGMYAALLPTWGDKVDKKYDWAVGPEVFTPRNAFIYGQYLGARYGHQHNIVWILGGDRNPKEKDVTLWNEMALGIASAGSNPYKPLMSFHPQPFDGGSSSTWFHQQEWLDFNMLQTGHNRNTPVYLTIQKNYQLQPVKPVIDGEPTYEAHGIAFKVLENGYSTDAEVRKMAYWNVFAGAFGHTYGCHSIWQFYDGNSPGLNSPIYKWKEALQLSGACQMIWLRKLMESRPMLDRIPDQSLILENFPEGPDFIVATRDIQGTYAMIYTPTGKPFFVNASFCASNELQYYWYGPKDGTKTIFHKIEKQERIFFQPPTKDIDCDWVLVIDAVPGNKM